MSLCAFLLASLVAVSWAQDVASLQWYLFQGFLGFREAERNGSDVRSTFTRVVTRIGHKGCYKTRARKAGPQSRTRNGMHASEQLAFSALSS